MPAALFASLVLLMAAAKKEEKKAIKTVLVAGTLQNLKQSILRLSISMNFAVSDIVNFGNK